MGWLRGWREWRDARKVRRMGLTAEQWEAAIADWPLQARYQGAERQALMTLSLRFLARKSVASGGGFAVTDAMCLKVATMACVPILKLGLEWYDGWYTVILYEGAFIPNRPHRTDDGVVHGRGPVLSGEAWHQGPVILSWEAVCEAGGASNVVIHEMSHKLDMRRNGNVLWIGPTAEIAAREQQLLQLLIVHPFRQRPTHTGSRSPFQVGRYRRVGNRTTPGDLTIRQPQFVLQSQDLFGLAHG